MDKEPLIRGARSLGLVISKFAGDEAIGTCPGCLKDLHLYFNFKKGVFDCKVCKAHGDYPRLCELLYECRREGFDEGKRTELAEDRGLPAEAFGDCDIGVINRKFLLPIRRIDGRLVDVRQYRLGQKVRSTSGCNVGLFGAPNLKKRPRDPIYLCEGEWDAIALEWLRRKLGKPGVVVGVPGAMTFKDHWREWFRGREVFACFDNDDAGASGEQRIAEKLAGIASQLHFISWRSDEKKGMDLRDLVGAIV